MLKRWKMQLLSAAAMGGILTVVSLSSNHRLLAQVKAALVQDVDQPARQPFQHEVFLDFSNNTPHNIPIPAGKRLVVEFMTISGGANATSNVQPLILFSCSVGSSLIQTLTIAPIPSLPGTNSYYFAGPVKIYSDSLSLSLGFSGSAPTGMLADIVISGHFISIP